MAGVHGAWALVAGLRRRCCVPQLGGAGDGVHLGGGAGGGGGGGA